MLMTLPIIDAADSIVESAEGLLPRITLVTPSYNQAAYLEQTILSVLGQGYENLEYILIDGASTDGSREIIEKYRDQMHYAISEPDSGQAEAINKGMTHGSGEVMGWLNSDDLLMPGALDLVGRIFAVYPEIAWISGEAANIDAQGHFIGFGLPSGYFNRLLRGGWYHGRGLGFVRQESTFWRRSLWERAGGLRPDLTDALDFDLWRRFARHAECVSVQGVVGAFRFHADQKSALPEAHFGEIARSLGFSLPPVMRPILLPLRLAVTVLSWRLAPRLIVKPSTARWEFRRGLWFRPGVY
jgi:glycosyltransferase involved in cell wall biosynthesis